MKNLENNIIFLMKKLYKMNDKEMEDFKTMLSEFSKEEKMEIAYTLWKKVKEEESIVSRFLKKIKLIKNDIEDYKTQQQADKLLADL